MTWLCFLMLLIVLRFQIFTVKDFLFFVAAHIPQVWAADLVQPVYIVPL